MQPYDWIDQQGLEVKITLTAVYLLAFGWSVYRLVVQYWRKDRHYVQYRDVPIPSIGPFDGPGATCTCENACQRHGVQLESAVIGSNFTTVPRSKIPKVQVAVYSITREGTLSRYLGVATRIGDWLVVPQHVIAAEEVISLLSMASEPALSYKIGTEGFEPIEGDLSAMRMSEENFSKLGMVKASLATVEDASMSSVTSSSKDPEVSFGILTHDTKVFGAMVFQGSTKGGFSGAPYMIGRQIAGIHLGGGVMNYGLNATYIQALLQKPEETAEWLMKLRQKRGKLRYSRSKFNPDEAQVFAYGRYHTVDLSLLEGDIEEPSGVPTREIEVEVNVAESFPPQYRDIAEDLVETINEANNDRVLTNATTVPKNLQAAELDSAAAEAFLVKQRAMLEKVDERLALLQGLQDSVSDRYREIQMMLVKVPKGSEGRSELVVENEKLKKELMEIKQFKTSANAEVSLLRVIPKNVRKANAIGIRKDLMTKLNLDPEQLNQVAQALVEAGMVARVVGPVGGAETTSASTSGRTETNGTMKLIRTDSKD